ncbi:hypothetical protein CR513_26902, partial [Mucuna pruriens]
MPCKDRNQIHDRDWEVSNLYFIQAHEIDLEDNPGIKQRVLFELMSQQIKRIIFVAKDWKTWHTRRLTTYYNTFSKNVWKIHHSIMQSN